MGIKSIKNRFDWNNKTVEVLPAPTTNELPINDAVEYEEGLLDSDEDEEDMS